MQSTISTITKRLFLLCLFCTSSYFFKVGVAQNCYFEAHPEFEANQLIMNRPFDGFSYHPDFLSVVDDNLTNLPAGVDEERIWFGGYKNGNLFTRTIGGSTFYLFTPGPPTADNFYGGCVDWAKPFAVRDYDILAHKLDLADNGVIDNPNKSIFEWPGRGNPYFEAYTGIPLPSTDAYAPFVDVDLDGIYDPMKGDFPHPDDLSPDSKIKEMRWALSNFEMINGGGLSELMERHSTVWALSCTDKSSIEANSIFVSHTYINRSQSTYDSLLLGMMHRTNLGRTMDDGFGYSQDLNSFFVYNLDNSDLAFGENPPVMTMTVLDKPIYKGIGFMSPYVGHPNPEQIDPGQKKEYWNYLNGKWRDGQPLTLGGNGYDPNGQPTNFIFDGNPSNPDAWAMVNESPELAEWRLLTSIRLGKLEPGDQEKISYCYSFHDNKTLDHVEQVVDAMHRVQEIQDKYDNGFDDVCAPVAVCLSDDCVWPGDTDHDGKVRFWDYLIPPFYENEIGDARGQDGSWYPAFADNWNVQTINQSDLKHIDASGDGKIDVNDNSIIEKNMDLVVPGYEGESDVFIHGSSFRMEFDSGFILPNLVEEGDIVRSFLFYENLHDLRTMAYSVEYDSAFFEPSFFTTAANFKRTYISEKADFAAISPDLNPIQSKNLGRVWLRAKKPKNVFSNETCIRIVDAKGYDFDGNEYFLGSNELCLSFSDVVLDDFSPSENVISIYPNPVISTLNIENIGAEIVHLEVISVDGTMIDFTNNQDTSLDVSDLAAGIYFLKIKTERGVVLKKFVKQ